MAKRKSRPVRRTARPAARKPKRVDPIPKGYGAVTPHLVIRDCLKAIAFYAEAFGARQVSLLLGPDGKVAHAELRLGDRMLMVGEEAPSYGATGPQTLGGTTFSLMHYVKDCDKAFARAVAAGAAPTSPPKDMFWGDRYGQVTDPFGHRWSLATRKVNMTRKQMQAATTAAMSQMAPPTPAAAGGQS